MFSVEETTFLEAEARHVWELQQSLYDIKRRFCRSGTGSSEIRDELEVVVLMSENDIIVKKATKLIAEIDRHWPPLVRYA